VAAKTMIEALISLITVRSQKSSLVDAGCARDLNRKDLNQNPVIVKMKLSFPARSAGTHHGGTGAGELYLREVRGTFDVQRKGMATLNRPTMTTDVRSEGNFFEQAERAGVGAK